LRYARNGLKNGITIDFKKPQKTANMKLSENWSIGYDTYNVVLECRETRTKVDKNGENKTYESVESFYYPTLKQALKSYLQKSLKQSKSFDEVLRRIDEVEAQIEALSVAAENKN